MLGISFFILVRIMVNIEVLLKRRMSAYVGNPRVSLGGGNLEYPLVTDHRPYPSAECARHGAGPR